MARPPAARHGPFNYAGLSTPRRRAAEGRRHLNAMAPGKEKACRHFAVHTLGIQPVEVAVMTSTINGLRTGGTVFALVSLAQFLLILLHKDVIVGGYDVPTGVRAVIVLITAGLAIWLWSLSGRVRHVML
jgi:hypothetical protein